MTNPMHSRGSFARVLLGASLLGVASLAACNQDKLLTAPTPDVVQPQDIASKAALPSAFAAAVGDFQLAYAGGYGGQLPLLDYNEGLAQMTALLSDEMLDAETYNTRIEVDRRATTNINSTTLQTFQDAQRARATADLVSGRYRDLDPTNPNRAEAQALAAFMYVLFAEDYCNGVPTSRVLADGTFQYGAPQSGTQLLNTAIAKFDSAITVATAAGSEGSEALNLAMLGKGRALLDLGQYAQAADDFDATLAGRTSFRARLGPLLWRYAAQVRARRDARALLAKDVGNENLSEWPAPIAKFLLGKMSAGELEVAAETDEAASRTNGKCAASFFIGIDAIRRGDKQRAREQLQLTQARCPTVSELNWAAASELKRL